MSAGGIYGAAVAARTRGGWVKHRECGELLHRKRFPLRLKGFNYKNYVRSAIPYGSEVSYLKESETVI